MKNIVKILMVALLVVVATISVSAVTVELNLADQGDNIYYLETIVRETGMIDTDGDEEADTHIYVNAYGILFTYDSSKMDFYSLEYDEAIAPADLNEYMTEAVEMVKTGRNKFNLQLAQATVDGDMVTIQLETSAPDGKVTNFPGLDLHLMNVAFIAKSDLTALTSDDFTVNSMKLQTWNGLDGEEELGGNYGYGEMNVAVDGWITVDNNVAPEAPAEEEDPASAEIGDGEAGAVEEVNGIKFSTTFSIVDAETTPLVEAGYLVSKEYSTEEDLALENVDEFILNKSVNELSAEGLEALLYASNPEELADYEDVVVYVRPYIVVDVAGANVAIHGAIKSTTIGAVLAANN